MPEKQTPKDALFEELSLLGLKAVQNYAVNKMPIAIAFPKRKIAIEVDDPLHEKPEVKAADEKRDAILESYGWRVLRIPSKDVEEDPTKAALDIEHFVGDETDVIEDPEEETIIKEESSKAKSPETKMMNRLIPGKTAESKIRKPKVSAAKTKKSKKNRRAVPAKKRILQKRAARKEEKIRKPELQKEVLYKEGSRLSMTHMILIGAATLLVVWLLINILTKG